MTYGEYRAQQREYERAQWAAASPEERLARWNRRQEYLRTEYLRLLQQHPGSIIFVLWCEFCDGYRPRLHAWPSYFYCLSCDSRFVIDAYSHLCNTDVEQVCILSKEA
jgi:hypothetical protein